MFHLLVICILSCVHAQTQHYYIKIFTDLHIKIIINFNICISHSSHGARIVKHFSSRSMEKNESLQEPNFNTLLKEVGSARLEESGPSGSYQSNDASPTILTTRQKEEKVKNSRRQKGIELLRQIIKPWRCS